MIPLFKFKIKGNSMNPAFQEDDFVLVNRLSYIFSKPKIGDIVVIKSNNNYIIKRIAKMNGDKYFILGDNKKKSTDSRKFGWISKKEIVGKVLFKISNYSNF